MQLWLTKIAKGLVISNPAEGGVREMRGQKYLEICRREVENCKLLFRRVEKSLHCLIVMFFLHYIYFEGGWKSLTIFVFVSYRSMPI